MTEIQYLEIYFGAWIILLLFYFYRNRSTGIGAALLLTYSISSFFSIVFYITRSFFLPFVITYPALLYVQVCTFIVICPFVYYSKDLSALKIKEYCNFDKLFIIFQILFPFVIYIFLESLYGAVSSNANSVGEVYETNYDSGGKESIGYSLSWVGMRIYHMIGRLYYLWPILLFECLRHTGRIRKMFIVPLLSILSLILMSYASASRVGIVRIIMYVVIIFYFYRHVLSRELYKKITRYAVVLGGGLIVLLFIITISRFSVMDASYTMDEWLSLYLGEGAIRFSTYIWDLTRTSDGDTSFSLIKSLLGYETFLDYYDRREYYAVYFGIPTNIFYTFVGDWYQDFGRYITPILCIIIAFVESMCIKKAKMHSMIGIGQIFILGVFAFFVMFGFMYYAFKTSSAQLQLLESSLALFLVLKYIR